MGNTMGSVDQRTQLAGHNRFEMLLFQIGKRFFGINVFKIREVIRAPRVTVMPDARPGVRGIAHLRNQTIPIVDLAAAIRAPEPGTGGSVVITEYNRTVQGFLVDEVDRIVNVSWQDVLPPPSHVADQGYVTAVTRIDGVLVQILDVEKVLVEVLGELAPTAAEHAEGKAAPRERNHVLVVDDSSVARNQIRRTLEPLGWMVGVAKDGEEGLEWLQQSSDERLAGLAVVISDIEMPRMDGYTLTSRIRADARLRPLKVLLHSSLSGVFNEAMVNKVGADDFLPKFDPGELSEYLDRMVADSHAD